MTFSMLLVRGCRPSVNKKTGCFCAWSLACVMNCLVTRVVSLVDTLVVIKYLVCSSMMFQSHFHFPPACIFISSWFQMFATSGFNVFV